MRKPVMAGNWKMNKTVAESVDLVKKLSASLAGVSDRDIVVCPPFTSLAIVSEVLKGTSISLGAQNMNDHTDGAYTGEVAPGMLTDVGCQYVILGHSERRQYYGETDELVHKKLQLALDKKLIPIVCVGELLKEREEGRTFQVIEKQIKGGVSGLSPAQATGVIIAYEPVWAIGTGKTATPAQAQEVHFFIRGLMARIYGDAIANSVRILYGGSVKGDNAKELMAQKDVDGLLVGGASLKADEFVRIIQAAA